MHRTSYLAAVERDAAALRSAAASAGLDTPVPTCPGWDVHRLVGHVGRVHRWTAGWAVTGRSATVERPPAGDAIVAWCAAGTGELLAALSDGAAERSGPVETWLGPQPASFWPRRMAIETALHRWDAQQAAGEPEPIEAELALDGIDEMLDVLVPQRVPGALHGAGETLHLHATDVAGEWLITLGPSGPVVERTHAKGDVAARGPASDLLLLLWSRLAPDGLTVFGDASLLTRWTDEVTI